MDYLSSVSKKVTPKIASNSVSVQVNLLNQGAGIGIVHDFVLKEFPKLKKILPDQISLERNFYLVRHEADIRVGRQKRFAERLTAELRETVRQLEKDT